MVKTIARLRYSPLPKEAYTVRWGTTLYGYGANKMVEDPSVWNLFWLSWKPVDVMLTYRGSALGAPYYHSVMYDCQDTCKQMMNGVAVSELVLSTTPHEFVTQVIQHGRHLELFRRHNWWLTAAAARVADFQPLNLQDASGAVIMTLPQSRTVER